MFSRWVFCSKIIKFGTIININNSRMASQSYHNDNSPTFFFQMPHRSFAVVPPAHSVGRWYHGERRRFNRPLVLLFAYLLDKIILANNKPKSPGIPIEPGWAAIWPKSSDITGHRRTPSSASLANLAVWLKRECGATGLHNLFVADFPASDGVLTNETGTERRPARPRRGLGLTRNIPPDPSGPHPQKIACFSTRCVLFWNEVAIRGDVLARSAGAAGEGVPPRFKRLERQEPCRGYPAVRAIALAEELRKGEKSFFHPYLVSSVPSRLPPASSRAGGSASGSTSTGRTARKKSFILR